MKGIVKDLGRVEYAECWALQKRLVKMRARDQIPDVLLMLEHDHVITLGRKTTEANLKPQDVPVFRIERGGDATYHGPGQLVCYPIMKIEDHDIRGLVTRTAKAIIEAAARFGVEATTLEGHPGVWVRGKKLASIGYAVEEWVSYHGFAINVNTDLSYFGLIRPCGLDPETMTSMRALLGRPLDMGHLKSAVAGGFSSATGVPFEPSEVPAELAPEKR
jgi:lipoate-protein ligase B